MSDHASTAIKQRDFVPFLRDLADTLERQRDRFGWTYRYRTFGIGRNRQVVLVRLVRTGNGSSREVQS